MTDYSKRCWYCSKYTMQPKGSYYLCTECSATWNEQPDMSGVFIDVEPVIDEVSNQKQSRPVVRRRSTIKR